jgi:hypothetical protein
VNWIDLPHDREKMAGSTGTRNEPSGSIKYGELLD